MYINKMDIISFGKYQDKEIKLTNGINVIYGDNEAGKSTIHKFIEGMLYGFYKPYRKNKQFTPDYDRFLPWNNSNKYKGILVYKHQGKEYRIERNFMKRNDKVEIFDNGTGENITERFEYDSATKLYQPASRHIGINKSTFNNTISIGQLSSKTSDELVKEVKDSLINLGESKDEEISVRNVIDKLKKKLDDIGTAGRKKTTPYGKLTEEIKNLKKEKVEAEKIWQKVLERQEELNNINNKLKEMENRKKDNEELLDYLSKEEVKKAYEEGLRLKEYIDNKTSELKDIEQFKDADIELIDDAIKKLNNLELCRRQYNELKSELTQIENYLKKQYEIYNQVKVLEDEDINDIDSIASQYNIYNDMVIRSNELKDLIKELKTSLNYDNDNNSVIEDDYEYTRLEEERKEIKYSKSVETELKEQKYQDMLANQKHGKLISSLSFLIFVGLLVSGIISSQIIVIAVSVVFACVAIYTTIGYRKNKGKLDILLNEINRVKSAEGKKQNKLDEIVQKQNEILKKHRCTELIELRKLKDKVIHMNVIHEDNKKRYTKAMYDLEKLELEKKQKEERLTYYVNLLLDSKSLDINNINLVKEKYEIFKDTRKNINHKNEDKKNRLAKYNSINEQISKLNKEIKEIADRYNVQDEKGFQQVKDKKYLYHNMISNINNKKELLSRLLGDNTLIELEQKLTKYNQVQMTTDKSKEELLLEQDNIVNDIIHISKDITSYETKIANLQKDVRPIVDIEEDISNKLNIKSDYDKKIKALTMARDAIENISRDIQNNFAPKLNKKVSNIISNITNKKYTDIKINPNMEILTYEPENHELISIDSLSKGTIDQMYFGLRLGLIDIIKEDKSLPLILDDCFVQYDNDRLKMVMETLENLDRQIVLLSCHRREEEILKRLNVEFNYIAL
ncbi:AAA family ATPase [Vallitalea sp.]|uniref:AAA family ATPase n=1 Tax=Vallitalea sp. TaxID=1882829 RepID=UPI0025FC480D|nr:AAA family ATPase [Vallitalea sp.]MCT4688047.1 AAA family ATPase [Vallitalea sp.]